MMAAEYARKLGVVTLMVSGLLLGACNNNANTNSADGPNIQLSLAPVDPAFTWPPNTPNVNSGNNNLQMLATMANSYQQFKWLPTQSNPPNYDWRAGVAPADSSGIRYLTVTMAFYSSCGGAVPGNNPVLPWSAPVATYGSPTGPVLAQSPLHIVELSPKVIGSYVCQGPYQGLGSPGQNFPGGEVGMYYITAKSINGNGKTTNASFTINIGTFQALNTGG
jgi:hypothetical protein